VFAICRTRTGLAACANVLRRALRFLLLYFAQTASPILVLLRWRDARATQVEQPQRPVAAGGARWGRFCVNGWKNRLGAGARSAFVSFSPCMAERSGLRARSELHGAGPEPVFPAKSEWSSFSCERRPSCMSPYRAPPAATLRRRRTKQRALTPTLSWREREQTGRTKLFGPAHTHILR
jgi:hypothetical protein